MFEEGEQEMRQAMEQWCDTCLGDYGNRLNYHPPTLERTCYSHKGLPFQFDCVTGTGDACECSSSDSDTRIQIHYSVHDDWMIQRRI